MTKQPVTPDQPGAPVKSSTITLRAGGATLSFLATRKPDGTAVTTVTTRDADKNTTRGMTETHGNFDAAKAHLVTLAEKAEKLGWQRGKPISAAKPDVFSKLPAPPKATA
jgi:hypothetical protein